MIRNDFPGYEFVNGKNMYRGEDVGFGGYVYAVPGIYHNVVCFDSASHHPSSILALNLLGDYTDRYRDILEARIAIKHKEFDKFKTLFDGKLAPYVNDPKEAGDLSNALKTVLNSVYGLTSASFPNAFRDIRNVNNIVALRGALFMVNLRDELIARGQTVLHIKTDSIKVENPPRDIFDFVVEYGKEYGYTFEIEHVFERICLVNNAVYIARLSEDDPMHPGEWTATGAQFAQPYVFKTLFSHEPLEFKDFCETKSVSKGAMYLDMDENLHEGEHDYQFVGRTGIFIPTLPGYNAGRLMVLRDDKYSAVAGTTGFRWEDAEVAQLREDWKERVDIKYHRNLVDAAVENIANFGDPEEFISGT